MQEVAFQCPMAPSHIQALGAVPPATLSQMMWVMELCCGAGGLGYICGKKELEGGKSVS